MSQIEEIADLLQQIVNLSESPVITSTATRALELADYEIMKDDMKAPE